MTGHLSDPMRAARSIADELRTAYAAAALDRRQAAVELCVHVCELLSVDRASVWELRHGDDGQPALTRVGGYDAALGVALAGQHSIQGPPALDYLAMLEGGVFASDDVLADDRLLGWRRANLLPANIGALMDSIIGINGTVLGVLCCEHRGRSRAWTTTELSLARALANEIAIAVSHFQQRQVTEQLFEETDALNFARPLEPKA